MTAKKKTTARTTGLTGNQFASVEQGRSYVLSVHSPSGAGEIELLAADSDQQSEPDMFRMLYEKIETARQIPFIAISPFVFVNVGSSDVQWLVTPANFSLAVPGVSSGGGESFDPEAPQEISGDWQFTGELIRTVKASPAANDVLNKEMGDNAYLQLATPNLQTVASDVNFQSPLGVGEPVDLNHAVSKGYSENNFVTTSTSQVITGGKIFADGGTLEVPIPISQGMAANKQYVDTSVVTGIGQLAIRFSSLTKAEYDALETKSNSTIYFLTDQNMLAIGDKEIVTSDMPPPPGIAMYLTTLELVAESAFETNVLKIPASAPSGIYELEFPGGIASYAFNVFAFENYDSLASSNQSLLELANPPLIVTNGTATVLEWMWDDVESASMVSIPNGSTIASLKCFFSHTQGTETNLLKLMGLNIFTSGISVKKVVVRQIA